MIEAARKLLQHIPSLRDKPAIITRLDGGLTNHNFKVDVADESYVLRMAGDGTQWLGIDRDCEEICARAAAAAGVGPEVVAYLPEHAALVMRFVSGKLLRDDDVQQPDVLRRLAETLRRCHSAAVGEHARTFSVFDTVRDYIALAGEKKVPLPGVLAEAMRELQSIENEVQTTERECLCHNDLLASNFIDDGTTIWLIDWEYAGLGDRFFDLGNLAVNLQLSDDQEKTLLQSYFGEVRPEQWRRLKRMRLASDMREASWGFLQSAISPLHPPPYYLDYGNKHLNRFLASGAA